MLRRRLFAYTVMMAAGITAGFFVLERLEFIRGLLIMAAAGISAALAEGPAFAENREDRLKLLAFIAAGFILFTSRFIYYEAAVPDEMTDATGIVSMIKSADNGYELILVDTGIKGISRIQVRIYTRAYSDRADTASEDEIPDELMDMLGRRVYARGRFREFRTADNPGCFDNRLYMRSRGIPCRFTADTITAEGDVVNVYWKYRRWLISERERFLDLFSDDEVRGFIRGVVFGDKSGIDEEIREEFNINTTGHILAVSGLHIGFLYALLKRLSGKRKTRIASAAIFIIIFTYGEMTLWSAATVRAVTVLCISMLAFYLRRPSDLLTSVSAAAFILIVYEPYQLFNSGFQLSFIALTAIAFLSGPLSHFTGDSMSALLAVQSGTAPLGAILFNRINPVSLLINIPVVWLAGILVPVCLILMMICIVTGSGSISGPAVMAAEGLAEIVIRINRLLAYDGFFSTLTLAVNPGAACAFYLSALLICSEWARIRMLRHDYASLAKAFAAVMLVSSSLGAAAFNSFGDDEIVFVSVGQGDCTHIRCGSHDLLIDGGGSTEYNVGKNTLMPYLLSNGTPDIDAALATHLHTDHFKGICDLCAEYPVGCVMLPEGSEYNGTSLPCEILYTGPGTRIAVSDDVYIEPIWPPEGRSREISYDDENENNMVYMVHYKGVRIMVTGDLLEEDELEMVDYYRGTDTLKCDVLKVAHHGSKSSSSEAFLDAASPSAAVIQVGKNNLYGHPHKQTLERLEERKIPVYRTDINGAVGIDIKRNGIKIDLMRNPPQHK